MGGRISKGEIGSWKVVLLLHIALPGGVDGIYRKEIAGRPDISNDWGREREVGRRRKIRRKGGELRPRGVRGGEWVVVRLE